MQTCYDALTADRHSHHESEPVPENSSWAVVPLLAALGFEAPDKDNEDEGVNDERDKLDDETSKEYL